MSKLQIERQPIGSEQLSIDDELDRLRTVRELLDPGYPRERDFALSRNLKRELAEIHEVRQIPPEKLESVTKRPVWRWRPRTEESAKIRFNARQQFDGRDHVAPKDESSEIAVQAALEYLYTHEHVPVASRITSQGGADIMALSSDGELIVVECKGTQKGKTLEPTWLTTTSGRYDNEAQWLTDNKKHMLCRINTEKRVARGDEHKNLEMLALKIEACDFSKQGTYRRLVVYAGQGADLKNLKEYDRVAKPDKYVVIPMSFGSGSVDGKED